MIIKLAADHLPEGGDVAVLSASATATNQNTWIEEMNKVLANYPGINVVATVYGDDLADKSYRETQGLMQTYPDLKAIIAPTSVGIVAAAQAVTDAGKVGQINVTGLGLPSEMAGHVESGASKSFAIWNPIDLGYAATMIAYNLATEQGDGRARRRDPDGPDGRGHARRQQRGRDGRPVRLRRLEHRRVQVDLLIRHGLPAPPRAGGACPGWNPPCPPVARPSTR